jgi:hypothetical protein
MNLQPVHLRRNLGRLGLQLPVVGLVLLRLDLELGLVLGGLVEHHPGVPQLLDIHPPGRGETCHGNYWSLFAPPAAPDAHSPPQGYRLSRCRRRACC